MTGPTALPGTRPANSAPAAASINQERLRFLARVARREAEHLAGTDSRLFAHPLTVADIERQAREPELAERVRPKRGAGRDGRLGAALDVIPKSPRAMPTQATPH